MKELAHCFQVILFTSLVINTIFNANGLGKYYEIPSLCICICIYLYVLPDVVSESSVGLIRVLSE